MEIETAIEELNKQQNVSQSIEFMVQEDFINNLPTIISNLEQVEQWAIAQTQNDRTMVLLTDEDFDNAKERSAQLNKQIKLIEDKRKEIKKAYNQPYEAFEKATKRVTAVLSEARENLWSQVTKAEEERKVVKQSQLRALWENMNKEETIGGYRSFEQIANPKWLNKTVSIEQALCEMQEIYKAQCEDISTIFSLNSEFVLSLVEYYKDGHGIGEVIAYNNRLNAQKQAQIERNGNIGIVTQKEEVAKEYGKNNEPVEEEKIRMEFYVCCTSEKLKALGAYMRENGIEYGRIKN